MGLVQVPQESVTAEMPVMEIEGARITWERDIDNVNELYGTLLIDYLKNFLGSEFVLSYEGGSC